MAFTRVTRLENVVPGEAKHSDPRERFESIGPGTGSRLSEGGPMAPLMSIRFFAVLHILVFHILAIHQVGGPGMTYPVFDAMPPPLLRAIERGYYSTSLFFLLSGFVLAYLYIGADRRMTISARDFWVARLTRIYPLHLLVLALLVPTMLASGPVDLTQLLSGICSALLIQAWVPQYALSWNFPTWALSTVVFFYLSFPLIVTAVARMQRWQMAMLLAGLPFISLIPSILFYAAAVGGRFPGEGLWHEFVMRTPLLWLPHFVMGVLLSCLFGVHRHNDRWRDESRRPLAWGDLAFALLCVILVVDQTWTFRGEEYASWPRLIMRNGALAPLYLVVIHDLARKRGLLGLVLDRTVLLVLGQASFSIFMLQKPTFMLVASIADLGLSAFPLAQFATVVLLCLTLALLSVRCFEMPISQRLRRRWIARPSVTAPRFR